VRSALPRSRPTVSRQPVVAAKHSNRELVGRARELEILERVLAAAVNRERGVLILHGDPGVGKTALLDRTIETAKTFSVMRTAGVEAEMELPFAALQQLCSPLLELSARLPDSQQEALAVAFALSVGPAPSPFLVSLAALALLSESAEEQPLLCVVDDAQWLDRASARALGFIARRLSAERIALLFAAREVSEILAGLPELPVQPLVHHDARMLLESVLPARLDEPVLDRLVDETHGNPLALLEMPRGLTPTQLAGGFGLPAALPLSSQIEENFTRRLASLPDDSRRLLLLAAADPVGDPALLWAAAGRLGIGKPAAEPIESTGLLSFGARAAFRHPLVRSAVYRASSRSERSEVHRALAEATDPQIDPDRRAWHRAQAATVPNEGVAEELEQSAARAEARGGLSAAAAFLERAVTLTPAPQRRAERALIAAQRKFEAGALDDSLSLLATAAQGAFGDLDRARIALLHTKITFMSRRGNDAAPMLLEAAAKLADLDPALARETYLEAISAAMFVGRLAAPRAGPRDIAQAAKTAPAPPRTPVGHDYLLDGLIALYTEGYESAAPILRLVHDAGETGYSSTEQLRWAWGATVTAVHLWDDALWESFAERHVKLARHSGALGDLPLALHHRALLHVFAGELAVASSLVAEADAATRATGNTLTSYGHVALLAVQGAEQPAQEYIARMREEASLRGEGVALSLLDWGEAILYNGLRRYEDARTAAARPFASAQELAIPNWSLAELVEAAVRTGSLELAGGAMQRLTEMAQVSDTDWVHGLVARCEALLADDERAEALYKEAIERLARTRLTPDLARAHLLYGEWLRRSRRRLDAREQLRVAHSLFSDFGMEAFAARTQIELQATGERARKRSPDSVDQLTPQEAQISRLAAAGDTNREIAAQLFLSPNTVEYHLRKAFRKLGIRSRTQLPSRLR
jgi:DNA-binding CsgD family transcriptional regulator